MDVLYWYYEESKSFADVIGQMVKRFRDSNFKPKYRIDVIQQLLQQVGLILKITFGNKKPFTYPYTLKRKYVSFPRQID